MFFGGCRSTRALKEKKGGFFVQASVCWWAFSLWDGVDASVDNLQQFRMKCNYRED